MNNLFVNNTDLLSQEWRFIEPYWTDPRAEWAFVHGVPQNRLEQTITRPNLARYRAAWQAVRAAAKSDRRPILVSHLPAMAAATNALRKILCPDVRQIAFAFNFTDLPTGSRLSYYRWALEGVDEFVVFSEEERQIYADTFGIPYSNIRMMHWAMEAPVAGPDNPVPFHEPYLCAIGGEGRDYALLADVMRQLPELKIVIVARPYSISGIIFPDNVHVFTNLPAAQTWRLAQDSLGLVLPLKSENTACGHITIVGAQLMNIPLAVTRSFGVRDYVNDETAYMVAAQNASELTDALRALTAKPDEARQRSQLAMETAQARSNLGHWVHYFETMLT